MNRSPARFEDLLGRREKDRDLTSRVPGYGHRGRHRAALESAGGGLLLLSVVISAMAGAEGALFLTMLTAWLLFPLLVGFKNALDAGCVFMLVSLGVVVVVSVARDGLGVLLP
jgi:hypothetical protein